MVKMVKMVKMVSLALLVLRAQIQLWPDPSVLLVLLALLETWVLQEQRDQIVSLMNF
jgi:hypothetical protein